MTAQICELAGTFSSNKTSLLGDNTFCNHHNALRLVDRETTGWDSVVPVRPGSKGAWKHDRDLLLLNNKVDRLRGKSAWCDVLATWEVSYRELGTYRLWQARRHPYMPSALVLQSRCHVVGRQWWSGLPCESTNQQRRFWSLIGAETRSCTLINNLTIWRSSVEGLFLVWRDMLS